MKTDKVDKPEKIKKSKGGSVTRSAGGRTISADRDMYVSGRGTSVTSNDDGDVFVGDFWDD